MLHGWANIPPLLAPTSPCWSFINLDLDNHFCTGGCEGGGIEIKVTKEISVGRERRIVSGGAEQIECEKCLLKQSIPFVNWEVWIDGCKASSEVRLESLNGTFSCIGLMCVRRYDSWYVVSFFVIAVSKY